MILKSIVLLLVIFIRADNLMAEDMHETKKNVQVATFAGGCFWCMEPPFDKQVGVLSTVVGYTGGHVHNPSYEQVTSGATGHSEAIQVTFDVAKVSYNEILDIFWRNIDPFDAGGQFCDRGNQYRSEIYYHDEEQKRLAEKTRDLLEEDFGQKVATELTEASEFYPAEDYHQEYYQKNPIRYKFYRYRCGRDARLKELWEASRVAPEPEGFQPA